MSDTAFETAYNVDHFARDRGYSVPVYVAADVYDDAVVWLTEDARRKPLAPYTTTQARLDALLAAALFPTAIAAASGGTDPVEFASVRVPRAGRAWVPRRLNLTVTVEADDSGHIAATIRKA